MKKTAKWVLNSSNTAKQGDQKLWSPFCFSKDI